MQTLILPELKVRGQWPGWEPVGRYPGCPPGTWGSEHRGAVGGSGRAPAQGLAARPLYRPAVPAPSAPVAGRAG